MLNCTHPSGKCGDLRVTKRCPNDMCAFSTRLRRAYAAASGGVRSKPLLAGERSVARGKGETGGQAPCVSGTKRSESR